ncbi:MAG: hypothetical protein LBK60_00185 [Verrucomicrobiales bacterium]|jgi:hypothetical protein|nr:hypothetical protein [Verrucomicrobiales bacterium]
MTTINSVSRRCSKQAIYFKAPLTGTSGARLISYEWRWKLHEYVDWRGEDQTKRVSDWGQAETSDLTGRDLVHLFTVRMPDGQEQVVSMEGVARALDVEVNSLVKTLTNAARRLAALYVQLAITRQRMDANRCIAQTVAALPLPPIEPCAGPYNWQMGDAQVKQWEPGAITDERKRCLVDSWCGNRRREAGYEEIPGNLREAYLRRRIKQISRKINVESYAS